MSGTFFGLNIVLRGLEAQQTAIDITGHNVANASTPGYSRQTAEMATTDPVNAPTLLPAGAGQMGTGVEVASIQRAHDDFVQQQILYQNGQQAQQQAQSDTLSRISQVFNEPTDKGFGTLLSNFFASWQALANNSSDNAAREVVAARGSDLAAGFQSAAASLSEMQQAQDKQIGSLVTQINGITDHIAALNQQITSVVALGQAPNDLADKRDILMNQLSGLVNIQHTQSANGAVNISLVGGGALVQGISSFKLATAPDPVKPQFSDVVFQGQTTALAISGGQLGGALTARDTTIATRIAALDTLAGHVSTAVNGFQSSGYGSNGVTGITFFTGSSAATIAVDPRITANVANIAAGGAPNQPADGSVALEVAKLQETPPAGGTITLPAEYNGIISRLGVDAQQAQTNVDTGSLILQQLNAQQSSVSGVSLNEEASHLMQYQRAYEAAARVISIMDQSVADMIRQFGG